MLRVGRFGDPKCKRIGFQNIPKVDLDKNNQLKAALMSFLSNQNPIKSSSVTRAIRKPGKKHVSIRQNALLGQQTLKFKKWKESNSDDGKYVRVVWPVNYLKFKLQF